MACLQYGQFSIHFSQIITPVKNSIVMKRTDTKWDCLAHIWCALILEMPCWKLFTSLCFMFSYCEMDMNNLIGLWWIKDLISKWKLLRTMPEYATFSITAHNSYYYHLIKVISCINMSFSHKIVLSFLAWWKFS
jgi:hypothetical protein